MRSKITAVIISVLLLSLFTAAAEIPDVGPLTGNELTQLIDSASAALRDHHTTDPGETEALYGLVSAAAESAYESNGITVTWVHDADDVVTDWEWRSVRMNARFDKGGGITHTDSICAFVVNSEIVWLKCGGNVVIDRVGITADANGIRAFKTNFPNEAYKLPETADAVPADEAAAERTLTVDSTENHEYVLNNGTMRFHLPSCASVGEMKETNRQEITATRGELIDKGYKPCGRCNP